MVSTLGTWAPSSLSPNCLTSSYLLLSNHKVLLIFTSQILKISVFPLSLPCFIQTGIISPRFSLKPFRWFLGLLSWAPPTHSACWPETSESYSPKMPLTWLKETLPVRSLLVFSPHLASSPVSHQTLRSYGTCHCCLPVGLFIPTMQSAWVAHALPSSSLLYDELWLFQNLTSTYRRFDCL